jgi:hypothetical protein
VSLEVLDNWLSRSRLAEIPNLLDLGDISQDLEQITCLRNCLQA